MDQKTKQQIESFAWDVVVGSGRAAEMLDGVGDEPGLDELRGLNAALGHASSPEELRCFTDAWDRCLREAANP